MTEPYPMQYTDGGGTRPVVVEPGALSNRIWWGSGPVDYFDAYTPAGQQYLHPVPAPGTGLWSHGNTPIGSRFD